MSENRMDALATAVVNSIKYADQSVDYPDLSAVKVDKGVIAEWFYPIYNGANDFSELSAIHLYTSQETKFDETGGELFLGIALVEMKHYAMIGDLINKLGGDINKNTFSDKKVTIGSNLDEALTKAIEAEEITISFYQSLLDKVNLVNNTETTRTVILLVNKLIADEQLHLKSLKEKQNERAEE